LILLDTSGVLAAWDDREPRHVDARRALLGARTPLLLSPFVLAELDYLIAKRAGLAKRVRLLEEVSHGAYRLTPWAADDVGEAKTIVDRYDVSLADASIVVLAWRHRIQDVFTLDERHFRVLPGPAGPFRLLPADGMS
jgi:predicted nucleic acid-binding protein